MSYTTMYILLYSRVDLFINILDPIRMGGGSSGMLLVRTLGLLLLYSVGVMPRQVSIIQCLSGDKPTLQAGFVRMN